MGNCFGRCLAAKNNLRRSSSQFENLIEDNNKTNDDGLIFRIMKTKTKKHSKFLQNFWTKKDVEYSRLTKNNMNASVSQIQLQCLDAHSLLVVAKDRNSGQHKQTRMNDAIPSPGSSLDLEWEHEYEDTTQNAWLPERTQHIADIQSEDESNYSEFSSMKSAKNRKNLIKRIDHNLRIQYNQQNREYNTLTTGPSSIASCSHISTPESLEWDVDQDQDQLKSDNDSLDYDTKELLYEIEQLKNRVLNETGDNLKDGEFES